MTRAARFEDIKNRHDLALAERNFTQPGTENFVAVRDHFLNEDRGTSQAYRMAFKKPMKFYHEHTPAEAVEILKREAEENLQ